MLNGVDKIPWDKLTHAYGTAEDVPQNLHALTSPDETVRAEAWMFFWGSVIHQGTVYDVTAYVVPFLLELLQAPDFVDKPSLLRLLAAYAQGSSYHAAHADLDLSVGYGDVGSPEWIAKVQKELGDVQAAHIAVGAGLPIYENLLRNNSDPIVRATTTLPLAASCEPSDRVISLLTERMRLDNQPLVQTSCLLALEQFALLQANRGKEVVLDEPPFLAMAEVLRLATELHAEKDTTPLIRVVAALVLVRRRGPEVPLALLEYLLETLDDPSAVAEEYTMLPWTDSDSSVSADISLALTSLDGPYAPLLIPRLKGSDWKTSEQATSMVYSVVSLCGFEAKNGYVPFHEEKVPLTLSELTPLQHETLLALCDTFDTWRLVDLDLVMEFHQYGLPDPRKMRHFLKTGEVVWVERGF
jgi:hypothetical protein